MFRKYLSIAVIALSLTLVGCSGCGGKTEVSSSTSSIQSEVSTSEDGGNLETSADESDAEKDASNDDSADTSDDKKASDDENADAGKETAADDKSADTNKADDNAEADDKTTDKGDADSKSKDSESVKISLACPSVNGKLSVKGTNIVDKDGNPVLLRGLSTHGLAWFPDYVNETLFREFRQNWNVNVMRLAMYTDEYGGYCNGGDRTQLKNLVLNGINYATNQDLYVIVDWHVLADQNPNKYKDDAIAFFKEIASMYKDYNNIIYEICNEPNGSTTWQDIKEYAEAVIPEIRKIDDDAIIIVGTPNWSQFVDQAALDPIKGYDNIMYALHFYADTHKDDLRNRMVDAIKFGLPIFVTEFGICDASGNGSINYDEAGKWVDVLNQYNVSHVMWNVSNKGETCAIFNSYVSKTSGFAGNDLSPSGKWFYKLLTGDENIACDVSKNGELPPIVSKPVSDDKSTGGDSKGTGSTDAGGQSTPAPTPNPEAVIIGNAAVLLSNSWQSGSDMCYQYSVTIVNDTDKEMNSWQVEIPFSGKIKLVDGWCGNYKADGNKLIITNFDYNGKIGAGASTSDIGFIISGPAGLEVTK